MGVQSATVRAACPALVARVSWSAPGVPDPGSGIATWPCGRDPGSVTGRLRYESDFQLSLPGPIACAASAVISPATRPAYQPGRPPVSVSRMRWRLSSSSRRRVMR